MRKHLLGIIGGVALGAMAMSSTAQAQTANWSGLSVGINGGVGWGSTSQTDILLVSDHSYTLNGGLFGAGIGYDMQRGPWVFGLLADLSWGNVNGTTNTLNCSLGCGVELRSFGTLRGRVGYATGMWMPYVTGGLAFGNVYAYNNNFAASGSNVRTGWTVGLGAEAKFAPNWSAKVEYLYTDLGSADPYQLLGVPESVYVTANILRFGVNYHLNSPAPLVRK